MLVFYSDHLLDSRRELVIPLPADLIEDIHLQQALIVTPDTTLKLPIPNAPRHLIRLEVPPPTLVLELALFFPDDLPAPGLVEVLHRELLRAVNRRRDAHSAGAVADRDARGREWGEGDAAGEHGLRVQAAGEVEREGGATVDAGEGRLEH